MKITKNIIIPALTLSLLLSSCTDNLTENIYGTINDQNFWKTEKDIREGINSAYGQLYTEYNGFSLWQFIIEDGGSDINASTQPYGDFWTYTNWSSTNPDVIDWGLYKYFWSEISYLNKTIDMIPGAEMTDAQKLAYTSEARALRAFIYFTLVQWFNDIPLVTSSKEISYSIPKRPAAEIYKFIEDEFLAVVNDIPTKETYQQAGMKDYVRLTRGAVMGLLARTYLVQKKYAECKSVCYDLIEKPEIYGKYELMPDYRGMFSVNGYDNSEFMWALAGDGVKQASLLQVYLYKPWVNKDAAYDIYYDWSGNISVTHEFYRTFDPADRRLNSLYYDADSDPDRAMIRKYPPKTSNKYSSATDFPVLRYADILLMYAESLLFADSDVQGAVTWVNKVRERAGAPQYDPSDYATVESFRMKIYNERRWELFFEGCGKRDMMRFGTLLDHIKQTSMDAGSTPERYYYLPFPSSALTANPGLTQNPGYTK